MSIAAKCLAPVTRRLWPVTSMGWPLFAKQLRVVATMIFLSTSLPASVPKTGLSSRLRPGGFQFLDQDGHRGFVGNMVCFACLRKRIPMSCVLLCLWCPSWTRTGRG